MGRISGLKGNQIIIARDMAMQAAFLGLNNEPNIHYTEGSARWQGINLHRKAWRGEYPNWADCSSFVTWCLWNGLDHFHRPDVVNGLKWQAGYTGTMLTHGEVIRGKSWLMRGDAIIYGSSWPGQHTAIYIGNDRVISHGSEAGPNLLPMHYREDILGVRRYI